MLTQGLEKQEIIQSKLLNQNFPLGNLMTKASTEEIIYKAMETQVRGHLTQTEAEKKKVQIICSDMESF